MNNLGSVIITCRPGAKLTPDQSQRLSRAFVPLFPGCNVIAVNSIEVQSDDGPWVMIEFRPHANNPLGQEAIT